MLGGLKIFGILTILGGLFYIMGGALGLGGLFLGTVRIGLVAGPIIMMGGILSSSKARKVRVAGSVLAILGVILAGIYLCGGLVAGLILTLTGSISALRYKEPLLGSENIAESRSSTDRGRIQRMGSLNESGD